METKDLKRLIDAENCVNCYFYASGYCSLNCEEATENESCNEFTNIFQN